MKEAVVALGPKVHIIDSPVPVPAPGQIVTKVVYSGCNPKDWKVPEVSPDLPPLNNGDDISGIVHAVGDGVSEFKIGDRVCAFHEMLKPGGSYAEYAVSWASTTMTLPPNISFEEAATIPLASLTACCGLFAPNRLALSPPWAPMKHPLPLLIYGASSAVGYYAVQLALRANIHPLICVAGRAQAHVEKLLHKDKGDRVVDYRRGDEECVESMLLALAGQKLQHAFDVVSEHGSHRNIARVLDPHGKLTFVTPDMKADDIRDSIQKSITRVGSMHGDPDDLWDFGHVFFRYIRKGLEDGWFKGQPYEIVAGGLAGIEQALTNLKAGKASAVKYIFKISDVGDSLIKQAGATDKT